MNWTKINPVWIKRTFILCSLITVGIFLLNFYLVGFGVYGDGTGYYAPMRSLVFDGDFKVTNEYEFYANSASKFGGGVRTTYPLPDYSKYTIGLGLILSPFFFIGHLFTLLSNTLGFPIEANGLTWPYELFYCLGSIAFGIVGLIFCYQAANRFFSSTAALIALVGVWFGSPLTFYLTIESSMSHGVSQGLISIFLYLSITTVWLKQRFLQILLGLILGLSVLVRPQNGLFLTVPLLLGLFEPLWFEPITLKKLKKAILNPTYLTAILIILGVTFFVQLPQFFVYLSQYETIGNIPYLREGADEGYGASFNWLQPKLFSVLFSGFRGLFIWHPLLLLGIIGLILSFRQFPLIAGSLGVAFCLQVYLISSWWSWWQGASFGGRMFSNCTFIFVFGLAALWDYLQRKSKFLIPLALTLCLILWNGLLVLQYESGLIPPEEAISIKQLMLNQFTAIPYFINHVFNR
ncbi:MAG: hypothetical protein AB4041_18215 [Microcystaceae cyanobacterium]